MALPEEHLLKYENVFVLGAGFSKAVGGNMPLMADLSEVIQERTPVLQREDLQSFFLGEKPNFELLLTYLHSDTPWKNQAERYDDRGLFSKISDVIAEYVAIQEMHAIHPERIPIWLQKLIIFFDRRHSPVLTFNYDTMLERAAFAQKSFSREFDISFPSGIYCASLYPKIMQDIRVFNPHATPPDGLGRRTFDLIKLHGSVNWLYSGTDTFPGEQIYFHECERDCPENDFLKIAPYAHGRKRLIIPPVSEKSLFYSNILIRTLWSDAKRALAKADNLYFIGYSLPESDITVRTLLLTAVDPSTHIFLVSTGKPDDEGKRRLLQRYQDALPQVKKDRFSVEYIRDDWPQTLTHHLLGNEPLRWSQAPVPRIKELENNRPQYDALLRKWLEVD